MMREGRKIHYGRVFMLIGVLLNIAVLFSNSFEIAQLKGEVKDLKLIATNQSIVNDQMLNLLKQNISATNENNEKLKHFSANISVQPGAENVVAKRDFYLDGDTDLCQQVAMTTNDMNKIIDSWSNVTDVSRFKDRGYAFIQASQITGLNPTYIFAHAAWESQWGRSYLAVNRNNFFGIAAFDSNPNAAYAMGDSVDDGIINGAVWIKNNYYNQGYTTLNEMVYAGNYASAKGKWVNGITSIANSSIRML